MPGDTVRMAWRASDPDRVTAVEIRLAAARGPAVLVARLPGTDTTARIGLSCPLPFRGAGTLRVAALDEHGRRHDRTVVDVAIAISGGSCVPAQPELVALGPRPNPFRDRVVVRTGSSAQLGVLDVTGRLVRRALPRAGPEAGRDATDPSARIWDGRRDDGSAAPPGLYFLVRPGQNTRTGIKVIKLE
jgi:hypothetical protein